MCSYREVFPYSPVAGLVNIDVNPDLLESLSAQSLQQSIPHADEEVTCSDNTVFVKLGDWMSSKIIRVV